MALLVGEKKDAELASVVNITLKQAFHRHFVSGQYYFSLDIMDCQVMVKL